MGVTHGPSHTQVHPATTPTMYSIIFTLNLFLVGTIAQNLPEVLTREGATTLVDFVVKAGLEETLSGDGPFTIFAPTNEAFEKLPKSTVDELMANPDALKKILLYHVIPSEVKSSDIYQDDLLVASAEGTKLRVNTYMKRFYYDGFLTVNGKRISRTDVLATNGVVHFISDVIDTLASDDCTQVLTNDGRFETLLTAVTKAGLVETLQGEGPFTVFAPTDEAFAKLPADTVENLLKPENKDQLVAVLTYHVVAGKVMAADVVKVDSAATVQGQSVTVKVENDTVMIDN